MNTTEKQQREALLNQWCAEQAPVKGLSFEWLMISGDASFRRYFRLSNVGGENRSFIAVDAPPEKEDSRQFCKVARLFAAQGCLLPQILATDFEQGFMLLSDLGDEQLLLSLNENNVEYFYTLAFEQLIKLQRASSPTDLPYYDHEKLMQEMLLFQEWFLGKYLDFSLSETDEALVNEFQIFLCEETQKQQQVYVHRDFHSRNLMIVDQGLAMIDFQDALIGPITYDAVSLLKDVYVEWPALLREKLLRIYFNRLKEENILDAALTFESFFMQFELMGLQRHLKILGIFARLSKRDGKHGYLKDLPLTFQYIEEALAGLSGNACIDRFQYFFVRMIKPVFLERLKKP